MQPQDSFTFTVGKLDAGMAILLGERAHLIEFPSVLLPPGATTGSIVNISVTQNYVEEKRRDTDFWQLQDDILETFGVKTPQPPDLQLRNVTQTSVTLEWPSIQLATAKLRSLDIYRNGQRLAAIPSPLTNTSTKLSGLELDKEYTFQLILRTTAGTFPSNLLRVKTHTMTDTSGICVCFGNVQDSVLLENAKMALRDMKAKWSDKIQIDTTQFVCTTPAATPSGAQAAGNVGGAPGVEYQRALQLSIPVVQPQWILACYSERKMVPIGTYYLGSPSTPQLPAGFNRPQSMSQASLHQTSTSSLQKTPVGTSNRASMPLPSRNNNNSLPAAPSPPAGRFEAPREVDEENGPSTSSPPPHAASNDSHRRSASMKMNFKFPSPPDSASSTPKSSNAGGPSGELRVGQQGDGGQEGAGHEEEESEENESHQQEIARNKGHVKAQGSIISPSSIEVPPPPPVEKERSHSSSVDEEDEVGDTVEVPLN